MSFLSSALLRQMGSSLTVWVFVTCLPSLEAAAASVPDFATQIEPILVKRCSECHGTDQRKGGLQLDSRANALKGGKSGKPALVTGHGSDSPMLIRILSADPDEVMPPKGERLTPEQASLIRSWIDSGAEWNTWDPKSHWAFKPILAPLVPKPAGKGWVRNEVDGFIQSRLEREGLLPAPVADPRTLVRRLFLDLTGLPPSPSEAEAWAKDLDDAGYDKLVDHLLSSPSYGEHIARWWLDLARYADSNGYQIDSTRSIWPYRDWVIDAFNQNMPFDRFTVEQLAGDLLPNPTLQQRIATGFNRNSKLNDEGGADAEEYRTKAVKDRVYTVATTWLGLSMNCAECHTHKYDPITHDDYYRFYSFFNNTTDVGNYNPEPVLKVPTPAVDSGLAYIRTRLEETRAALRRAEDRLPSEQAAWEKRIHSKGDVWESLVLQNIVSTGGSSYTNLPDRSVLGTGVNPIYDTITFESEVALNGVNSFLLEVLPDPSLPGKGPGRWSRTGNFILDELSVYLIPPAGRGLSGTSSTNLVLKSAVADWEQDYYRAEHAIDRNPKTGWAIGPKFGERHFLIVTVSEPLKAPAGTRLGFRFESYHGSSHVIGRWRMSISRRSDTRTLWPVPHEIHERVHVPASRRSHEQKDFLARHYRTVSDEIRGLERTQIRLQQKEAGLLNFHPTTLVMEERKGATRETYVHLRGNFLDKGKVVEPGTPAFLPPLSTQEPTNRLGLARWLVDPANPLTARTTVNRIWERLFGTAIAKTSEDLGRMGEPPSHPELIDWLAAEFILSGWDIKALQRKLVLSATYRQSSETTPEKLSKDFFNRLISRGCRYRLDAETLRDQALALSGLLTVEHGGASVYPLQVPNLWKEIGFLRPELGMDEWPASEGPALYRRGVYTFWRRVCTYPALATFDAPSRELCTSRRPRTNTPLQALAALNEPTFLECARVFAERVLREGGDHSGTRIDYAFRLATGRPPTPLERARMSLLLSDQLASFKRDLAAAESLLKVGPAPRSAAIDPRAHAAWMMVANVLLNLDEVLNKN